MQIFSHPLRFTFSSHLCPTSVGEQCMWLTIHFMIFFTRLAHFLVWSRSFFPRQFFFFLRYEANALQSGRWGSVWSSSIHVPIDSCSNGLQINFCVYYFLNLFGNIKGIGCLASRFYFSTQSLLQNTCDEKFCDALTRVYGKQCLLCLEGIRRAADWSTMSSASTIQSVLLSKDADVSRRTVSRHLSDDFHLKFHKPVIKPRLTAAWKLSVWVLPRNMPNW